MPDELLTRAEAAARLNVPVRFLQDAAYRGTGPEYLRLSGRVVRYRVADLDAWLATRHAKKPD